MLSLAGKHKSADGSKSDKARPGKLDGLEKIEAVFQRGLFFAVREGDAEKVKVAASMLENQLTGVFYEGSAMGLALLDLVIPWTKRRCPQLLSGEANKHRFEIHVGMGLALARLKQSLANKLEHEHPLLRWLVADGYGFHEGYFHSERFIRQQQVPTEFASAHPYVKRAFDQGLGRSLWFSASASPDQVAEIISSFEPARQADLWSGVGFACSHAGGAAADALERLSELAGTYKSSLKLGVAFSAMVRKTAEEAAPQSEMACRIICEMTCSEAADLADNCSENLPEESGEPAYEVWRQRIQKQLT